MLFKNLQDANVTRSKATRGNSKQQKERSKTETEIQTNVKNTKMNRKKFLNYNTPIVRTETALFSVHYIEGGYLLYHEMR